MSRITRIAALVLVAMMLVLSMTSCGSAPTVDKIKADSKIVMLTNASFPPFEYTEGDAYVGVDVDIANEIAKDLGVTLEVQNMEFAGIVGAIKSGKGALGVAGMSITEDRLKNVDFSEPYFTSKLFVLVMADNAEINSPDDLTGKSIAVQTGTTSDTFASMVEGAEISRFSSFIEAANALKTGKVVSMVVDEMTADEIIAANPEFRKLETMLADESYAIAIQKGNQSLLDAVNATIARLKAEGKIDEFIFNHTTAGAAE